MTKIVLTAEVEDLEAWERGFRSHRDLFQEMGFANVYEYSMGEGSEIAVCVDVGDVDAFLASLDTPDNVAAMEADGIDRDSVKVFVFDKALQIR